MATADAQPEDALPVALLVTWSSVLAIVLVASAYISFGPEPEARRGEPLVLALPPFEENVAVAAPSAAAEEEPPPAESAEAEQSAADVLETMRQAESASEGDSGEDAAPSTAPAGAAMESADTEGAQTQAPARTGDSETAAASTARGDGAATQQAEARVQQAAPAMTESAPQQLATLRLPEPEKPPAWEVYGQPFDRNDPRPRIAVVITGLGLSESATMAAIKSLPPEITLSFTPYSRNLNQIIALARANGHEVMLDLPMEPLAFPDNDPGPRALLTGLAEEENLARLNWLLARGSAYVGLASVMGSRFTASLRHMTPVMQALRDKGLLFLDNRSTDASVAAGLASRMDVPFAINNRLVDERQASRVAIDSRLAQIERIALAEGAAVAMARPFPVTFERLLAWTENFEERGLVLAPITALANRQPPR